MRRQLAIGALTTALVAGAATVPASAAETTVPGSTATATASTAPTAASGEDLLGAAVQQQQAANAAAAAKRKAARAKAKAKAIAAAKRLARQSRDMVGIERSLYRGRYYVKRHESVRRCIVRRESNGYYRVENRSSSAAGAYQFLLSTSNYVARKMDRRDLVGVPASRWNRLEQDKAFWTLWNHGRGRGHWAGGNYAC